MVCTEVSMLMVLWYLKTCGMVWKAQSGEEIAALIQQGLWIKLTWPTYPNKLNIVYEAICVITCIFAGYSSRRIWSINIKVVDDLNR